MSEVVARCRECGYEQHTEFANCCVCGAAGASAWWCEACRAWRDGKACPSCNGALVVPREVLLGSFLPGTHVPVRFIIRNPNKRPVDFTVSSRDRGLAVAGSRYTLRASESAEVRGAISVGPLPPGPRTYTVRFETATPVETSLVVHVLAPVVRLEFSPPEVSLRNATPGKVVHRTLAMKNTGNVPIAVKLRPSAPWLSVLPESVEVAVGASVTLKLAAKTRRTEYGERVGSIRAEADSGAVWDVPVRVRLPEPELEAECGGAAVSAARPVDLGSITPERAGYESVTLRNTGKVRVACSLASDQPWLAVTPKRVVLPPGREKVVKLRATFAGHAEGEGPRQAVVSASYDGRELLGIPVVAVWHVPKPVLAPIRRQTIGSVACDAPATRGFRVANTGDGRLRCSVTASEPWVTVVTPEVEIGPGKKRRVELLIDAPSMAAGRNVATIRVRSNGGDLDVPLTVVVVDPRPELEVVGDAQLGTVTGSVGTGHLSVRNVGVGLLTVRAEPDDPRVSVTPAAATVAPGLPVKLGVAVATDGLAGGDHAFGVRVSGNGGDGRAVVRFRVPVEVIDLPSVIDMGDRAAGRAASEALRIRNAGTDPVKLRLHSEDAWLRLAKGEVAIRPGELVAILFTVEPPQGQHGPVAAVVCVEGRSVRRSVAVRAVARKVEVVLVSPVVELGGMVRGASRTVSVQVANRGEMPAEVRESHTAGELEVWVRRQTVQPGTTAALAVRVRLPTRGASRQVQAVVPLTEELSARFTATVTRPLLPRVVAGFVALACVAGGAALGATTGWLEGGTVAVAGLVAACAIVFASGR